MTKTVKLVLTFASGGIFGSLVTFLLVKSRYEKLCEKEIAEIRKHYFEKLHGGLTISKTDFEEDSVSPEAKDEESVEETEELPKNEEKSGFKMRKLHEYTDYHKIAGKYSEKPSIDLLAHRGEEKKTEEIEAEDLDEELIDEEALLEVPEKEIKRMVGTGIYIINEDTFSEANGYNKCSLSYFDEREELMDSDGEFMRPYEDYIGDRALKVLLSREEGVIYVRNEQIGIDYEIVWEDME